MYVHTYICTVSQVSVFTKIHIWGLHRRAHLGQKRKIDQRLSSYEIFFKTYPGYSFKQFSFKLFYFKEQTDCFLTQITFLCIFGYFQ